MVRIPMRKDDDISGRKLDGLSIRQLDDRSAIDDEMVKQNVCRPQTGRGRHHIRRGRRKTPWSRELSAEEHRAVQLDAAQNLGECIHSVPWTFCKVSWLPCKAYCIRKAFEQVMETLGHGSSSRRTAQL